MTLADPLHLIDVNILIARIFEGHEHHPAAVEWFDTPGLQWALCPWSEAGVASDLVPVALPFQYRRARFSIEFLRRDSPGIQQG